MQNYIKYYYYNYYLSIIFHFFFGKLFQLFNLLIISTILFQFVY